MAGNDDAESAKLHRERDLYRQLLALGAQTELGPLLEEALALVVRVTGARRGYLELHDERDTEAGPRWSIAHGYTEQEIAGVRSTISRGIIAAALASGETIVTASALLDPRFGQRESVRAAKIDAVLCAPMGTDPPIGVLYLQGRDGAGAFSTEDRATAELFARHLAPLADRLLVRHQHEPDPTAPFRRALKLEGIVGRSDALAGVLRQVALVAPLDINVLLTGESGTGKSQIARVIHDNGARAGGPFVELNCAALPEALIESELFGALPGAHSTATHRVEGKVAAAEHGTLFLDEIGELSPPAQAKLLHLLHARAILSARRREARACRRPRDRRHQRRPGSGGRRASLPRGSLLSAAGPAGARAVARRAAQDVAELAAFFCANACARHGQQRIELSRGALRAVESAEWPGNVRQLAHAVEAAAIRAAGERAPCVERTHVFPEGRDAPADANAAVTFQEATRRFQAGLLREALEDAGWNVMEVARRLDLARSHVYNLIRAFGLERGRK